MTGDSETTLASRSWRKPQRDWLQRIANQTKAITIVDRGALDDDLLFRGLLQQFQGEVWAA